MIGDILQPTHLLFILVVALLVLGPKRLPEVGRSLGRGMRDFRSALSGEEHHDEMVVHTSPSPTTEEPQVATAEPVAPHTGEPAGDTIAEPPSHVATEPIPYTLAEPAAHEVAEPAAQQPTAATPYETPEPTSHTAPAADEDAETAVHPVSEPLTQQVTGSAPQPAEPRA